MNENEISKIVVDTAIQVHRNLGPGLFESVYERIMAYELDKRSLSVATQVPVPIHYDSIVFNEGFRADIIVNDLVILELKSISKLGPIHRKQLHTYLRLADKKLGLLLNFGEELMKNGIARLVNGLDD